MNATIAATPGVNGAPLSLVQYSVNGGASYATIPLLQLPFSFLIPGSGLVNVVARAYDISSQSSAQSAVLAISSACGLLTSLTATVTAADKIYDGTTTTTVTSCTLAGVLAADVGNLSCNAASASFADTNAGSGKTVTAKGISLSGPSAANYTLSSMSAITTANIAPAALMVTADSTAVATGTGIPLLTYTITGFVAGDSSAVVFGIAAVATTATATSPVGTYPITFTFQNLTAANYSFNYFNGALTIYSLSQQMTPLLFALSPATVTSGGMDFTLTVTGANFATNSVVLWNGAVRTTMYVGSTQLTAAILAEDITNESTSVVTVANPAPNAATSAGQPFAVMSYAPVPTISGLTITPTTDGSGNYVLALTGTDLISGSVVQWNDASWGTITDLTTTYVSSWTISAILTANEYGDWPSPVTVSNPAGSSAVFELQDINAQGNANGGSVVAESAASGAGGGVANQAVERTPKKRPAHSSGFFQ